MQWGQWHDDYFGTLWLGWTSQGVARSHFSQPAAEELPSLSSLPSEWTQALADYGAGDPQALLRIPCDTRVGTPFQRQVWGQLRAIPFGETRSYGDIAKALDKPGASRAVGRANGSNPCLLLVPCHRVIDSQGGLGGFSAGLDLKRRLLRHEGLAFAD